MSVILRQNADGTLNLTFRAGETVSLTLEFQNDDGSPLDLTGHSFTAPFTASATGAVQAGEFVCTPAEPATNTWKRVALASW